MDRERARAILIRLLGTLSTHAQKRISEPLIDQFLDALEDRQETPAPAAEPAKLQADHVAVVTIRKVWINARNSG